MSDLSFNESRLFDEGERLPAIKRWLVETIWTGDRYTASEPEKYLRDGEAAVCRLEEVLSTGAPKVWDELAAASASAPTLRDWLGLSAPLPLAKPRAAVVFDGLSLREMPLLLRMAEKSGLRVKSADVIATCLPTETLRYVEERVLGQPVGPSRLRGRTELAERNVEAFYLEQPNAREAYPSGRSLLVWSSYPDRLFFNDEARSEALFGTFHKDYIPTIWKCTVQALPAGVPIVVTADHGYTFFGADLESVRQSDAPALLGQARWKQFAENEVFPEWHPDLQLLHQERIAMLRGRLRARPQGSSSRKVYQHGGFSLMEVLVPWIELERA
jgi:hypothetical protein